MTVKELIEQLKEVEDLNIEVYIQKDPEGNGYYQCSGVDDNCALEDDNTYNPESVGLFKLSEERRRQGYSAEDASDGPRIVVIFP